MEARTFPKTKTREKVNKIPPGMSGGGEILTLGEVSYYLTELENKMLEDSPEPALPQTLRAIMDYVDHFKKGDEVVTLQQMREACRRYNLSQYEIATICNLLPHTAEEARVLLPDLKRHVALDDSALQNLLDTLSSCVRR